MRDSGALLLVVGGLVAILAFCVWLAARVRSHGIGGGPGAMMGPFEEIYHPSANRYRQEIQIEEQRMVPLPAAEDKPNLPEI